MTISKRMDGRPASSLQAPERPDPKPATSQVVERYRGLFPLIKAAVLDPKCWKGVEAHPDFPQFLLDVQSHLLIDFDGRKNHDFFEDVFQATGLRPSSIVNIDKIPSDVLAPGRWKPYSAGMRLMIDSAHQRLYDESAATSPFLKRVRRWNRSVTKEMHELGPTLPTRLRVSVQNALGAPRKDAAEVTKALREARFRRRSERIPLKAAKWRKRAEKLEAAADWLDARGEHFATELERTYRAIHRALKPLKLGIALQRSKDQELEKLSNAELRGLLFAGSIMSDFFVDLEQGVRLLRAPETRRSRHVFARAGRWGFEFFADFLRKSGELLEEWYSEAVLKSRARQLVFGMGVLPVKAVPDGVLPKGINGALRTISLGAASGTYSPSVGEVEESGRVVYRRDYGYPCVGWLMGGASFGSRGPSFGVSKFGGGFSIGDYSRSIGYGIPLIGGLTVGTDKDLGPFLNFGMGRSIAFFLGPFGDKAREWLPSIGVSAEFYNPWFVRFDRPIELFSEKVLPSLETAHDAVKAALESVRPLETQVLSSLGAKLSGTPSDRKKKEQRLDSFGTYVMNRATPILETLEAYRVRIEKCGGNIVGQCPSDLRRKIMFGLSEMEANRVIVEFVSSIQASIEKAVQKIRSLEAQPKTNFSSEQKIREEMRRCVSDLSREEKVFAFVNVLLSQALPRAPKEPVPSYRKRKPSS